MKVHVTAGMHVSYTDKDAEWLKQIIAEYFWNLTNTIKQGNRACTRFAAFDEGVQLIGVSAYAEIEKLSLLNSLCNILVTGWRQALSS